MKRLKGFTLAEVLITLAIIGVVAAIAIPSVISNSQQQEFKTGLRKAVSVLNSAITMNMAIDGETPYDNKDTFNYLIRHMSVLKTTSRLPYQYTFRGLGNTHATGYNAGFYTTDGMRFEMDDSAGGGQVGPKLHESDVKTCMLSWNANTTTHCGGCGSYGLNNNPNGTTKPPCLILVDVNGDRKPNPANVNCYGSKKCWTPYKYSDPLGLKLTDMFTVLITDRNAIPYGVAAQRAMYQAQK